MKMQILFNDTKYLITTTLKELAQECGPDYTEIEVFQVLNEMRKSNQIQLIMINQSRLKAI